MPPIHQHQTQMAEASQDTASAAGAPPPHTPPLQQQHQTALLPAEATPDSPAAQQQQDHHQQQQQQAAADTGNPLHPQHGERAFACSSSGSSSKDDNVDAAAAAAAAGEAAAEEAGGEAVAAAPCSMTSSSSSSGSAAEGSSSSTSRSSRNPRKRSSSSSTGNSGEGGGAQPSAAPSADAKQRARLKRQFVRNQWLDINKAPSWPPIKKNRYLQSDWQSVDFRPQAPETKKSRLFLNTLCYLCEGVITKKSTLGRRAGLGLFCEKAEGFEKGAIITEFVGWLVDREQAEQLRRRRRASHIVAVQKGFLYIDGVKDPYYGTGAASFANDGSEFLGGPGNNSHFYHWFDDEIGRTRVFLRAARRIENGEEIFVPYDKNYWQDNFEEQEENCPDAFRKKKIEQLQKKYNDYTITSMQDLKARQALLEQKRQEQQEKKAETKRQPKKHNIKRPLSAYMRFSVERRKEIVEKFPEMRHPRCFKEIAQRISQEWKELNDKRKKELETEAAADLAKYKRKVAEWKEKHAPKKRKRSRRGTARAAAAAATPAPGASAGAVAVKDKPEKRREQHQQEAGNKEGGDEAPEAAAAVTDVPESSDEVSSNSRQVSPVEADIHKPMEGVTLAAEAASAPTAI
ncbi:hypothetical protein Efla_005719 [Eimeria flavescens]